MIYTFEQSNAFSFLNEIRKLLGNQLRLFFINSIFFSFLGSQDNLNKFNKPNLMVRSNPIGLAEPSVKRDGYSVGKDGSFYRSSENLFENKAKNGRSASATPDRELGNWKDQRRSSTSSTSSG